MSIKVKIQEDFITAFKAKNEIAKRTLSSVKAKFTEAEKKTGATELSDVEYLKVIDKMVKQREQSIAEFEKGGRQDLVDSEKAEIGVLVEYLPKKMSDTELYEAISVIASKLGLSSENNEGMKSVGTIIKEFNASYPSAADGKVISDTAKKYLGL